MSHSQPSLFDRPRQSILPDRYLRIHRWWPVRSVAVRRHVSIQAWELGDRVTAAVTDENDIAAPTRLLHMRSLCLGVV